MLYNHAGFREKAHPGEIAVPNELYLLQMMSGGMVDTWAPLVTMLGMLGVGLVYFLAPALGYTTYNRGLLLGSLWVLIARTALSIFRTGLFFLEAMDQPSGGGGPFSGSGRRRRTR